MNFIRGVAIWVLGLFLVKYTSDIGLGFAERHCFACAGNTMIVVGLWLAFGVGNTVLWREPAREVIIEEVEGAADE